MLTGKRHLTGPSLQIQICTINLLATDPQNRQRQSGMMIHIHRSVEKLNII